MATMVERRAAARRLFEETAAPAEWIAGALGIEPTSLDVIARREGWRVRESIEATIDRLIAQLSAQLRLLEARAAEADTLSKPELDALLAITRTFDRLGEMKRAEEARRGDRPDRAEIERAHEVVERRVGELAEQRSTTMLEIINGGSE